MFNFSLCCLSVNERLRLIRQSIYTEHKHTQTESNLHSNVTRQAERRRGSRQKKTKLSHHDWQLQIFFVLLNQNILLWNLINAVLRRFNLFKSYLILIFLFTSILQAAHPCLMYTEKLVLNVRFVRTTIDWYTHKCFDINNIITWSRIGSENVCRFWWDIWMRPSAPIATEDFVA